MESTHRSLHMVLSTRIFVCLFTVPIMEDFALTVDYTHGILYQVSLNNAEVTAVDLPPPNYPMSAAYDAKRHRVYWTDFQRYQILESTIWGKNKTVVFNTGQSHLEK